MTLIITELSHFGIAMAADSALTVEEEGASGLKFKRTLQGADKLLFIPHLQAGISWWGLGSLPGAATDIHTDAWLADFIHAHTNIDSMDDFAETLAHALQQAVQDIRKPLGFHLAGYVDHSGQKLPTFYHIRNVEGRWPKYDFLEQGFISAHEIPPTELGPGQVRGRRNGDYGVYAILSQAVEKELPAIKSWTGLTVPHQSLDGRLSYIVAWVKFVSDLYGSAMSLRTIGGPVHSLAITPEGHRYRKYQST